MKKHTQFTTRFTLTYPVGQSLWGGAMFENEEIAAMILRDLERGKNITIPAGWILYRHGQRRSWLPLLVFVLAALGLVCCCTTIRQAGECVFFAVAVGAAVNLLRRKD